MQDTNLRKITPPIGPPPRRRGLLIGAIAVLVLAVAGGIWFLASRDSGTVDIAAAALPTTTVASTETPTTAAVTPTTQAPPTTAAPEVAPPQPAWPSLRFLENVAFDTQSGLLVMFGGTAQGDFGLADTWTYDPVTGEWTERDPSPAPPLRYSAATAYDPGLDRVVLFGGAADDGYVWGDLWLYDSDTDTWETVAPDGGPAPVARVYASMIYVDSLGGMLLHGGGASPWLGVDALSDTWLLDTSTMTWTEIVSEGPGQRLLGGLAYDPIADRVVLSGGRNTATSVWVFDPDTMTWSEAPTQPALAPSPIVYDPTTGSIVGPGLTYSVASDAWNEIAWGEEIDAGSIVLDPERNALLMLGPSLQEFVEHTTLWEYDLNARTWRLLGPRD